MIANIMKGQIVYGINDVKGHFNSKIYRIKLHES